MSRTTEDLTGRVFGRLMVIREDFTSPRKYKQRHWECRCQCGETIVIRQYGLKRGTQSCGCLQRDRTREASRTHGMTKTPLYNQYKAMLSRCRNPNAGAYRNYGGRGIRVCDRWMASFANFVADVGQRPSLQHSLDRIDNDGHYEPGNVRWTRWVTQANNRRTNHYITHAGERLTVAEWARRTSLPAHVILKRLTRGWPTSTAMTAPLRTVLLSKRRGALTA